MMLTPAAERLRDSLRAQGRHRVELRALMAMHRDVEPHVAVIGGQRSRLLELIDELRASGSVTLPQGKEHYDRQELPHLPAWVGVSMAGHRPRRVRRQLPLHPALRWAATLQPPPTPADVEVLTVVARFLLDGGAARTEVPAKERSLELFGDEYRLEQVARGRLFRSDRLSYEQLRCCPTPPPFVWTPLTSSSSMLVVENSATYWTFQRLLRKASPVGVLVYGAGNLFTRSVAYADGLTPPPSRILYVGDIDGKGITIPWQASALAESMNLPAVEPAEALYDRLLECAPRPARHRGGDPRAIEWLPVYIRGRVETLLGSGLRIAQEALGFERLLDDLSWRQELCAQLARC